MLVLEEQRYIHEDLERLEQGIADRIGDEPKHVSLPTDSSLISSRLLTANPLTDSRPPKPRARGFAIVRSDPGPV